MMQEIMPGYKQTEVGVIPKDWDQLEVDDLVSTGVLEKPMDGNHGAIHPKSADFVGYGIPFVMANNLVSGRLDIQSCVHITRRQADGLQKGFARTGDILLTHKATIGETAIVGEIPFDYLMLTPQVTYYRVRKDKVLDRNYLFQFFRGKVFQTQLQLMSGGGTRSYIGITAQRKLRIVLPNAVEEQHAIAAALADADALIAALEGMIAKKRDLKQAAMQHLLTGKTRLPGFSGEWEVKRLGDFANFLSGTYLAKGDYQPGSFVVQGAGAAMGDHNRANFPFPITVIGRVGTVGRPRFIPAGCWVNNNAAAIRALPGISEARYVHLLLTQYDWSLATSVTAQPFLGVGTLMGAFHELPRKEEQSAIADVIFDMDADLAALEAQAAKARAVKQGMMQELLTGRVRLV